MKKCLAVLAVILLSLVVIGQISAGETIPTTVKGCNGDKQVRAGKTIVKGINFYSSTAGDNIKVYDANITTGPLTASELRFEIGIAANTCSTTVPIPPEGVVFGAGVFIDSNNPASWTSVVYDY